MSVGNVISVLEPSNRICKIDLNCCTTSQNEKKKTLERNAGAIPGARSTVPVIWRRVVRASSSRFVLGWICAMSATSPCLPSHFRHYRNSFLSATHLVHLRLHLIPRSGYISPEAMATCLSMLSNLEELYLQFYSPQYPPDQESRRSPPSARAFLPALTKFWFEGVKEYLEDLVSRVDAPRLYQFWTTFFYDVDFDTPELNRFISRTPTFGAYDEAYLIFDADDALVRLQSHPGPSDYRMVEVRISCQGPDMQLPSLLQICTSSSRLLLTMENLYIDLCPLWRDDIQIENTEWLDLLLPFTAVKNLYLSRALSSSIAPALQELTGGRTTEVLPALQNVFLQGFQP